MDLSVLCVACEPVQHMAVDHHFNGYNDVHGTNLSNGEKGVRGERRGPCSHSNPQVAQLRWEGDEEVERCRCPGFKAAE